MLEYSASRNSPLELKEAHDPDSKIYYNFSYKPVSWVATTASIRKVSVVRPTVNNGHYYICTSGGITGGTEPTWPTIKGDTVEDGDVTWKAYDWGFLLAYGETIAASTWTADNANITLASSSFTDEGTQILVSDVPSTITEFTLTNHITTSTGEEWDRSVTVPVAEL